MIADGAGERLNSGQGEPAEEAGFCSVGSAEATAD